jgi:GWxTD domain-containing protein
VSATRETLRTVVAALCIPAALMTAAAGARVDPAPPPDAPIPAGPEDPREAHREAREAIRTGHYDGPTTAWREGPARYLLSAEEDLEYRRLLNRDERARFIARFWEKRDPDPTTPENEFRLLFDHRVASASSLFAAESTKPGWKTDRGKIFILLGPPDDFDETLTPQGDVPVIIWTYRNPPAGTTASPNTQVRFVRDASGEYRLTTNLRLFAGETPLSAALAIQAMQVRRDRPEASLLDRIAGGEAAAAGDIGVATPDDPDAPIWSRASFFRAAPGLVLVVLTVAVREDLIPPAPPDAPPPMEIAARLASDEPGGSTYDLAGARSLAAGRPRAGSVQDGRRLFQGGAVVRPGAYHAWFAAVAHGTSEVHSASARLIVPPLDATGLEAGPIFLAAHCDRLPERAGPDFIPPFAIGRQSCVPRLDPVVERDGELAFYYQVRGAVSDPIEGLPDLDLTYRLFTVAGAGAPVSFGHPIHLAHESAALQSFSLSAAGWAAGAYRLRVTVTDNLTGNETSSEVSFRTR